MIGTIKAELEKNSKLKIKKLIYNNWQKRKANQYIF
jgi:hypothetical protein